MKTLLHKIIRAVCILVAIGMLMTGFADILDPRTWGWMAMAGYAYPFMVALNFTMMVVCIFFRKRLVLIPFFAMLLCYSPTMKYCPINRSTEMPDSYLTIVSYNTWSYGASNDSEDGSTPDERRRQLLEHIAQYNPDIICFQESSLSASILEEIRNVMPQIAYADTVNHEKGSQVMLLSRYPISGKERIEYESDGNLSAAFTVNVSGREFVVVNNHLESNMFSSEEKQKFSDMVHGGKRDVHSIKSESRFLLSKLTTAARLRAPQAEAVATYVRLHKNKPLILCGDFNDIPISYARRTIANELTDCYKSAGSGFGFSYHKSSMHVRIDNIMCSSHFDVCQCMVDNTIDVSDHYPIIAKIAIKD